MGLLRSLVLLPVKGPVDGASWIVRKIHESAEQEWRDPATIRQMLRDLESRLLSGDISEEDYDEAETALLHRLEGNE